ncbi:hypothetical protein [Pseudoalteromonas spongiae]|uniref:hypothetical protein n=1 Tax=Pseudoalteromonas spongiae TaxID=298657 RepID=UPI000C2D26FE|nr:hypothetical protein [Pseudoalteromonas spongiae]
MEFEQLIARMKADEKNKPRGPAALKLIDMALEHDGSGAKAAALIILSLEADNWFKFSAIELIKLDEEYRECANQVLLGVSSSDFQPSAWLERLDIDVSNKVKALINKWKRLKT